MPVGSRTSSNPASKHIFKHGEGRWDKHWVGDAGERENHDNNSVMYKMRLLFASSSIYLIHSSLHDTRMYILAWAAWQISAAGNPRPCNLQIGCSLNSPVLGTNHSNNMYLRTAWQAADLKQKGVFICTYTNSSSYYYGVLNNNS